MPEQGLTPELSKPTLLEVRNLKKHFTVRAHFFTCCRADQGGGWGQFLHPRG